MEIELVFRPEVVDGCLVAATRQIKELLIPFVGFRRSALWVVGLVLPHHVQSPFCGLFHDNPGNRGTWAQKKG